MSDEPRGPRITQQGELLNRQVHPSAWQLGRVTSAAFYSSKNPLVSVDRQSLSSPEASYHHHTVVCQRESAGTWCVSVHEVEEAGLEAHEDAEPGPEIPANPAHAVITGIRELKPKEGQRRASKLAAFASQRACQFAGKR